MFGLTADAINLYFTVESEGTIRSFAYNTADLESTTILITGLRSPRGLCIDTTKNVLYVAEYAGRIQSVATDGNALTVQLSLGSHVRLEGVAFLNDELFWSESSTLMVAKASTFYWKRIPLLGHTTQTRLKWPRQVVVTDSTLYFAEYAGRISSSPLPAASSLTVLHQAVFSSAMNQIDGMATSAPGQLPSIYLALD